jgi:hypothetical protein
MWRYESKWAFLIFLFLDVAVMQIVAVILDCDGDQHGSRIWVGDGYGGACLSSGDRSG